MLTPEDLQRYSRQIILPQVGQAGQERLKAARVLIVGVGGLGAPLALYLAAAGIGELILVDPDHVSLNNLHRQILYAIEDLRQPKVEIAARELSKRAPTKITTHTQALTEENAADLIQSADIVCDGTDNFTARYLVNDFAIKHGKPNVHAAIFQFQGQISVFGANQGPCYRCLFPNRPKNAPSCAEAGVFGVLPGVMALFQATEVIKLILNLGDPLIGRLLLYDALAAKTSEIKFRRNPNCPSCGPNRNESFLSKAYSDLQSCEMNPTVPELTPLELKQELESPNPPIVVDVREAHEREISTLPNTIHIPRGEIADRIQELDPNANLVIQCRSGGRSAQVAAYLLGQGFKQVRNLATGINGWAKTVDPTVPTY
ncbi:hypothetical protein ABT09_00265 [bacterium SCN 57-13]|nr:MAG: hypothetical protein ABT09_00265 [bacterium SCN 57-13]